MTRAAAQGQGKNGTVTVGERVRHNGGTYTIDSLGGGSHTFASLKDDAGYTYNVNTADLEKVR